MKDMTNKEAIEVLKNNRLVKDEFSPIQKQALDLAIKALEAQGWIPVSKRIPETHDYYLTSTIYNQVYCDYWNGDCFDRTETVLAWMPLPEPYTKEEDDT